MRRDYSPWFVIIHRDRTHRDGVVVVLLSWFIFVMPTPADKFFLHVTPMEKSLHVERCPFAAGVLDQLPVLVGNRSGQCHVEITRRYFRNQPLFVIAADDNFANKGWPVCAVINDRWFRGALVVLAERNRDPADPPLQGDTFLDGLTADECKDASSFIGAPPGTPWQSLLPRRNRVRY